MNKSKLGSKQHQTQRPVFLDLGKIQMPVTAVVSILHRATGVAMVLLIPVVVYFFDQSLVSEESYQKVLQQMSHYPFQCILAVGIWGIAHHFCAGIRFLLIDIDIGVNKANARAGAWLVNIAAIIITLLLLGGLL